MSVRRDILEAALLAVTHDRAATYGPAEDSFGRIAAVWSALLGVSVTPAQVALMLIALKQVRAWGNPAHTDNWVDIAGYAACGAEVSRAGKGAENDPPAVETFRPWPAPPPEPVPEPATAPIKGPFLDHERQFVAEMMEAGHDASEIARRLGRTPQGVGAVIGKLRLLSGKSHRGTPVGAASAVDADGSGTDEGGAGRPGAAQVSEGPDPAPVQSARGHSSYLRAPPDFSAAERAINAHLGAVGDGPGWTPEKDLMLAASLLAGHKLEALSDEMAMPMNRLKARWTHLNTKIGDLEHQAALLKVLKHRAGEVRAQP